MYMQFERQVGGLLSRSVTNRLPAKSRKTADEFCRVAIDPSEVWRLGL